MDRNPYIPPVATIAHARRGLADIAAARALKAERGVGDAA